MKKYFGIVIKIQYLEKMKIINEGFPKGDEILLDSITCTYTQEVDCTEDRDEYCQEIVISTRDGGGGKFLNIKTDSWSISDENDIIYLINDFKARMNYGNSNNS